MKFILAIILSVCSSFISISVAQGLRFVSSNFPIDQRTSYDVFKYSSPEFSGYFDVEFDLSLLPEVEIGYILRIKDKRHPMTVYNLFYDCQGNDAVFRLNEEGRSSLIILQIPGDVVREKVWHKVRLKFDMHDDSVLFAIDNYTSSAVLKGFPEKFSPEINFGKSGYFIDVPSFAIKNLSVGNKKKYKFPLAEVEGKSVHDIKGRTRGEVENPLWMMNDMYKWRHTVTFEDEEVACAGYDFVKKNIYWFDRDSIHTYNIKEGKFSDKAFLNRCPVRLSLGTNFIDAENASIYAYEVFYEGGENTEDTVTVASLDLETNTWSPLCNGQLYMQMHHHGSFFDRNRARYTIFGGFGNMHYNGKFFSFDLQTGSWYEFPEMTGDKIYPRYFTSLGYDSTKSVLYVFGGMGNESGEHIVGRRYLYDFYAVNLVEKTVKHLWSTDMGPVNIVPVRNLILEGSDYFYTLCYPESHTYSNLQLYRFSINDGTFEKIADTIPIYSDRIMTNANLYYDRSIEKLIATVQESDDDVKSTLKVYTLSLPTKESIAEFTAFSMRRRNSSYALLFIALGLILGVSVTVVLRLYYRKKETGYIDSGENLSAPIQKTGDAFSGIIPGSINLFGLFKAIDREGNDVSELFTEKQRQMLCILLANSLKGGISSSNLSLLLWPGRPADKMKSTRNTTISYLRKSLTLFDDVELVYRNGLYTVETGAGFHCDYLRAEELLSKENPDESGMNELISILSKGKFLLFENDPLFDDFKESVESRVEPVMTAEIVRRYELHKYKSVMDIADIIFSIDPLNGTALRYIVRALCKQKRLEDALLRYQVFIAEYKQVYDEDYPYQFDEL